MYSKGQVPWNKGKRGLQVGWNKGLRKDTDIRVARIGISNTGRIFSTATKEKMRQAKIKKPTRYWLNKKRPEIMSMLRKINVGRIGSEKQRELMRSRKGVNHPRWIVDRSKLCRKNKQGERRTSAYFYWRKSVWERDNFKCKISNNDCIGKIEAHHILSWSKFPELRYEVNNGITLCKFHHSRKRSEEIRLAPIFQNLIK